MKASLKFFNVLLPVYCGTRQQFLLLTVGGKLGSDPSNEILLLSGTVLYVGEPAGFNVKNDSET